MTSTVPVSHHELLLAVAGRVDDDLLAWARELVAVGEEGRAVELLTAALIADRVALPAPVRTALVATGRTARSVLDVDVALPPARPETATPHVFDSAQPAATTAPVTASILATLHELLDRQLVECRTWLAWRRTPAGSATGPLPHPVVLVELACEAHTGADVLSYQLATALARGGVAASVEVFSQETELPEYHLAARRAGRLLSAPTPLPLDPVGDSEPAAAQRGLGPMPAPTHEPEREPKPEREPEPLPLVAPSGRHADQEVSAEATTPVQPPAFGPPVVSAWWAAAESVAPDRPETGPEPARTATVEPLPPPASLIRPAEPTPSLPDPAVGPNLDAPAGPLLRAVAPEPVAEPARAADDPLDGPLRDPLLAMTIDENDPLGVEDLFASRTAGTGGFDPVPRGAAAEPMRAARPESVSAADAPLGEYREAVPEASFTAGSGRSRARARELDPDRHEPEPEPVPQRFVAPREPGYTGGVPQGFEAPYARARESESGAGSSPRQPEADSTSAPFTVPRRPEPAPRHGQNGRTASTAINSAAAAARPAVPRTGRDVPPVREPARPPGRPDARPYTDRQDPRGGPMPGRPNRAGGEPAPPWANPGPRPAPDPEPVTPVTGSPLIDPTQLGLRPGSLERLSPTDRALLARLQNEMGKRRASQDPARPAQRRPPNPTGGPPRPRPMRADPPDVAD